MFLYQLSLPDTNIVPSCMEAVAGTVQGFVCEFGIVPAEISGGQDLYTLLTGMFVHGGWGHIFGNMLFLWVFGDNVEDAFGHFGYLVFYLITGLAASFAQIWIAPDSTIPSVGASGAISGVLGAYLVFFGSNPVHVLIFFFVTSVPAWVMILLWIGQQFFAQFGAMADTRQTGGVAYMAHIGGFVTGVVLALAIRARWAARAASGIRNGATCVIC